MMSQLKFLFALLVSLLLGGQLAIAQDDGVIEITSPSDGQSLFGLVEILGSASHPTLFDSYVLEWSNIQNTEVWLPIQQPVTQQVNNGILGQWDTVANAIPDGVYQIRLQVFRTDGSVRTASVLNLVLANNAPTSIPTALPTANTAPIQSFGATPTSLILQPPTATIRPTFEALQVGETTPDSGASTAFINYTALQNAFCNGVFFTFGLFALVIVYLVLRGQISPYTRRLWWQIRSEFDNDRG